MNVEKIKSLISELQKEINTTDKNQENKRECENYFYYTIASTAQVIRIFDGGTDFNVGDYELGNYFQTEEEAKKMLEKVKIYNKLKKLAKRLNNGVEIDWKDDEQEKYWIVYANEKDELDYACATVTQGVYQIYCLDKNFVDIAKQEIGEENLMKLFE